HLKRQQVRLPGTVDASPIYLRGVLVHGRRHHVFFVTTSYGRTVAVDAAAGAVLWTFTPVGYRSWAGSDRITNSTPVADPSRRFIYAGAPNGRIYKLAVGSGAAVWSTSITRLPAREKLGTALNYSRGLVLATTGGYLGDAPPYQGHVAAISAGGGRIVHIWNSLCSNRPALLSATRAVQSGKDGLLRLLRLPALGGRLGRTGGELQRISTPGGSGVFTAICVWRARAGVRIFVGDDAGTWSYGLAGGRLKVRWRGGSAGTSPVLAGGLLYVYDPN